VIALTKRLSPLRVAEAKRIVEDIRYEGPNLIDRLWMMPWYVELSLTGLVDSIADSQLFGVAHKAFTDVAPRLGVFEKAASGGGEGAGVTGGAVFLDEIGDLSPNLQMKLLPSTDVVAPEAQVTARVVPAESVGGDFYQLFKLREHTTGVMIGDVSGHGYRAALIMALAMSASAIHAQNFVSPGEMLGALLKSMREELESTEMFISMFYGVVDPEKGKLSYAYREASCRMTSKS
jgi:hypothetical protein